VELAVWHRCGLVAWSIHTIDQQASTLHHQLATEERSADSGTALLRGG
jgi:hypothetical protein